MRGSVACLFVVVLAAAACGTGAITFRLDDTHLGSYDAESMLQYPEWRVGIFAEDDRLARFAPGARRMPYIDVDVTVTNPPHDFAELFVFRYEGVRAYDVPKASPTSEYQGWHPCQPQGQSHGALLPFDVSSADNARHVYGVAEGTVAPTSTDASGGDGTSGYPPLRIRGRVNISETGMYILHINACRQRGSAVLDVSGWHRARLNGRITVVNPYGGVPGQAYGYLPMTILCLFVVQMTLAPLWGVFFGLNTARRRSWYLRRSLPVYQIATTVVVVAGSVAYVMMIVYVGHLNQTNDDSAALYAAAGVFSAFRNTVLRVAAFYFAIGHRITTTRSRYSVVCVVAGVAHFVLGALSIGLGGAAGLLTPSHAQVMSGHPEPIVAVGVVAGIAAVFEFFIVLAILLALRRTHAVLRENTKTIDGAEPSPEAERLMQRRRRLRLIYRWYTVLVLVTVATGAAWWLFQVTGTLTFMRRTLATWRLWWLPDAGYELVYAVSLLGFVLVTLPTPANLQALVPGVVVDLDDFHDLDANDDGEQPAGASARKGPAAAAAGSRSQNLPSVDYGHGDDDDEGGAPHPAVAAEGQEDHAHLRKVSGSPPTVRRRALYASDSADPDAVTLDDRSE